MVAKEDVPSHRTIATQTSRSASPLFPLLPITEHKEEREDNRPVKELVKLPPALHLGRSVTDLRNCDDAQELYSARFQDFFASARALKREKRREKLYGSLPNLDMSVKNAMQGLAMPVAHIKEHATLERTPRRYHSIADLNNMRNKFTLSRYATNDDIVLKRKDGFERELLLEKRGRNSAVSNSQAPDSARPLSVVGRSSQTQTGLDGLLQSESLKTLNINGVKNYQFQRSKTHVSTSSAKTNGTSINTDDGLPTEKPSIYKLAEPEQLTNTPRDNLEPITHVPLLSPGDSDRMYTPELSKYVNGNSTLREDGTVTSTEGGMSDKGYRVPVIHGYQKSSRQTPKMVLKYYGSEIAVKSGIAPSLLPDNSKHIRSIISGSTQSESTRSGRKVSFREKKRRKDSDAEKKLATSSLIMTADTILLTSEDRKPLSLTTKNLEVFTRFQEKRRSKGKEVNNTEANTSHRVAEWVKARHSSVNKVPQIIPIKQTKSASSNNVPCTRITEVDEAGDKPLPPPEVKVTAAD